MKLREILKEYLEKNEYEGLVNIDLDCGCTIEDFMPCDAPYINCEAGYKKSSTENKEFDWIIVPGKKPDKLKERRRATREATREDWQNKLDKPCQSMLTDWGNPLCNKQGRCFILNDNFTCPEGRVLKENE